MDALTQRIAATVKQLVEWLVAGDFASIERYSNGVRLSASMISDAILEYGHKLVMPPPETFENLDVIKIIDAKPNKWSVRFDLWSEDEGRSDLTLECTLIDSEEALLIAEVDNLDVL